MFFWPTFGQISLYIVFNFLSVSTALDIPVHRCNSFCPHMVVYQRQHSPSLMRVWMCDALEIISPVLRWRGNLTRRNCGVARFPLQPSAPHPSHIPLLPNSKFQICSNGIHYESHHNSHHSCDISSLPHWCLGDGYSLWGLGQSTCIYCRKHGRISHRNHLTKVPSW